MALITAVEKCGIQSQRTCPHQTTSCRGTWTHQSANVTYSSCAWRLYMWHHAI